MKLIGEKFIKFGNYNSVNTMKTKHLVVLLIFVLMLTPFVLGEQKSLGTYKRGECVTLIQSCANCTYVNFTSVFYPNSTQLMGDTNTTQQGSVFTTEICNITSIGTYIVNGMGDPDGKDTVFAYDFGVTPNGKVESSSPTGLGVALFLIVSNVGLFLIYFLKKRFHENKYTNFVIKRALLVINIFFTMFNLSIITSMVVANNYDLGTQMFGLMEIVGWIGYVSIFILLLTSMFQLFGEDEPLVQMNRIQVWYYYNSTSGLYTNVSTVGTDGRYCNLISGVCTT